VNGSSVRFREDQRFTQWWLWLAVLAAVVACWAAVLGDRSEGDDGSWWIGALVAALVGVGVPVLFAVARLRVEVEADRIVVRFRPFTTRTIGLDTVDRIESVTYRPLREYGGWGIKGWSRRKVAYNVRGTRGVLVTLVDGRTVLLGSQDPEAMAAAIRTARSARSTTG
jgi:uncharacterized membrane protein (DUF441 family)